MAFGVDTTSHATPVLALTSITWAHTCGASANKLLIFIGTGASVIGVRTVSTVTYNGVACSFVGFGDDASFERCEIWQMVNPPTGSAFNIVATCGGAPNQLVAGAISYIDAAASLGAPSSNTASTANPSVTVVDSASGDHVVSMVASDEGPLSTMTENGTLIWEDEDVGADSDFNAQRQVATGASTVCGWTAASTGQKWATVGVAVKPLVAPPAGAPALEESGYFPSEPQTNPTVVSSW